MDEPSPYTIDDISSEAVEFFVKKGTHVNRIPGNVDPSDVKWVLDHYNFLSDGKVTFTAMILFSERPRRVNDGAFLKIGQFDSSGLILREEIIDKPMIMIPDAALDILYDKYIPSRFGFTGEASRSIVYDYPRDSVRELIVNAIVHMNYRDEEPVTVSVYPDHIEIFSRGGLQEGMTVDMLKIKHDSVRRNKKLADVFHDAGFVENWAQGIQKVLKECRMNGNPEPLFVDDVFGLRVSMYPRSELILTHRQTTILNIIASNPNSTASSLAESVGVTSRTIYTELKELSKMGLIEREGSNKNGSWKLSDSH
ncbi:MAG: ATP-binding protein [Thermoplasmata archaeon]|nr:ATP-binding protein [Thermoplasmata archaeon]